MKILCVDDDEGLLYLMSSALENLNYTVVNCLDTEIAIDAIKQEMFDLIIVDQEMPKLSGLEMIKTIRDLDHGVPIIMVTGAGNELIAVEAMRLGASDYLVKDTKLAYLQIMPTLVEQTIMTKRMIEKQATMEKELEMEKARARLMTQFIRDASHEFRTPLTIIQTSTYLLSRLLPEENQQKYIARIQEQSDRILNLVIRLIHLAQLDNLSSLPLTPLVLNDLIKSSLVRVEQLVNEKKLDIQLNLGDHPLEILADEIELEDALVELFENACHASSTNGVIYVSLRELRGETHLVICDQGLGMSHEDISRIFERFYRVDEAHSTAGFGLGLPIVKRILELHSAYIELESEKGKGTIIHIYFPKRP